MRRSSAIRAPARRRGQAMVVAILGLTVLMALAIGLSVTSRLELRVAQRGVEAVRKEAALKGEVNRGIALIEQARKDPSRLLETLRTHRALQWAPLAGGEPDEPPAQAALQIVDASSRLNVNSLSKEDLKKLPQMDEKVAAAIVRWREEDEGDDDQEYAGEPRPYTPKDRPFDTVQELLMVGGVDRAQFFGAPTAEATRQMKQPPYSELLAALSGENNTDAEGNARADVNRATAQELLDAANREGRFITMEDTQRLVKTRDEQGKRATSVSQVLQTANVDAKYWGPVLEGWTVDRRSVLPGRVNVNTAPAIVLGTLPGMTQDLVQAVLQARSELPGGLDWPHFLDLLDSHQAAGVSDTARSSLGETGAAAPPAPAAQANAARVQALGKLEKVVCFRSCYYLVRVLIRDAGSRRTDAATATVYLPASEDEPAKIVQWRRPDRFPGWTAWYRPAGESEGLSRDQ